MGGWMEVFVVFVFFTIFAGNLTKGIWMLTIPSLPRVNV